MSPKTKLLILSIALTWSCSNVEATLSTADPYEGQAGSPEALNLIRSHGFTAELYRFRSNDGCPLSAYHIINPMADQENLAPFPVIIFHGVAGDAAQMISHSEKVVPRKPVPNQIVLGPGDESLAFMMSNNNYDVWLVDARGTNLNNHEARDDLDLFRSQKFWNYSLDEQLLYDVPRQINFVLDQTNSNKLIAVGYSESTFFMFALLSAKPEFAEKLVTFVALAPVAYVNNIRGLILPVMAPFLLTNDFSGNNYMPQPIIDSVGFSVKKFCGYEPLQQTVCSNLAKGLVGSGVTADSRDFYNNIFKTTSAKALKHFMQLHYFRRFGMFDYGILNQVMYNQPNPPDYKLSNIRLPTIILVRGGQDLISNPEDQKRLIQELRVPVYKDIWLPRYNHIDMLLADDIVANVNLPVLQAIHQLILTTRGERRPRPPGVKLAPIVIATPIQAHIGAVSPLVDRPHLVGHIIDGIEGIDSVPAPVRNSIYDIRQNARQDARRVMNLVNQFSANGIAQVGNLGNLATMFNG